MSAKSFRQLVGASPSSASPSDSTLVIIDAQNEYAEGALKVTDAPSTRKAIASLLEKYRSANGKIVHVVHQTPEGAPVFTPKTKLAEEFEELTPKNGEKVVGKNHPSSFADTDLHEHIGGGKVVLTGYMVCCASPWCDLGRLC
jgi:nicotinamidase-related amidase